jgi:hypothetical protein
VVISESGHVVSRIPAPVQLISYLASIKQPLELALTEALTRGSDRPDPVQDQIWDEAVHHYDAKALACLVRARKT